MKDEKRDGDEKEKGTLEIQQIILQIRACDPRGSLQPPAPRFCCRQRTPEAQALDQNP